VYHEVDALLLLGWAVVGLLTLIVLLAYSKEHHGCNLHPVLHYKIIMCSSPWQFLEYKDSLNGMMGNFHLNQPESTFIHYPNVNLY
jgi:hypothetical protein